MFFGKRRYLVLCSFWVVPLLALAGCVSTNGGSAIVVGNATESVLTKVVITAGTEGYEFGAVPANSESDGVPRVEKLAPEVTFVWESASGDRGEKKIKLTNEIIGFKGNLLFQLDRKGEVKVFMASEEDSDGSELPWSLPASWEGAPTIPGMNM